MGFKIPHIGVVVGMVCIGVALIFQIIGLATTGWVVIKTGSPDVDTGLWETCFGDVCTTIGTDDIPEWLEAVRAFGILGVLTIAACLVVAILICFSENNYLPIIAVVIAFIAALCVMIEFAVYAGEGSKASTAFDYGYSFALTIVAFVLCLVAGVCFLLPKILGGTS